MIIGVDCDGVLTNMSAYILTYGEKWFKRSPSDPSGYGAMDAFGCTEREEFKFGLRFGGDLHGEKLASANGLEQLDFVGGTIYFQGHQ